MMDSNCKPGELFEECLEVMEVLLGPDGCPWDRSQTHQTLKRYLIEEAYEVYEVIDDEELEKLPEELGDVLLQVIFHSQLGTDRGNFNICNVLKSFRDKMVRRHPHVFGDTSLKEAGEVEVIWEQLKAREPEKKKASSIMDTPKSMAPLYRAEKIQKKAARVGFQWSSIDGSVDKIDEELRELEGALLEDRTEKVEEELGDLLFSIVNVCRYAGVDPVDALQKSNDKFVSRFQYMEKRADGEGNKLSDMSVEDMEKYWKEAKNSAKRE